MYRVNKMMKPVSFENASLTKRAAKLSVVLAGVLIGGCAAHQKDDIRTGSIDNDYRTSHPIVVSQSEKSEDLVVAPSMRRMSTRHRGVVTDVVGKFNRSGADSLHVMLPAGSHNETAARHVAANVVEYMKTLGLSSSAIKIERYHAANHGDAATIRLVYGTLGARVASECGQWNSNLAETNENVNYENFGCATQNNLAEMIANPADLLSPRGESEIDASRRDNVINDWRANGS